MHLQAGTLLGGGKYKIEKVLGQGGFGITYLAEQTSLGRKVAIKEFFMEGLCNRDAATSHVSVPSVGSKKLVERFKQKFIKEARNIASLEHKHIVPIIDVFEENGTAYYVMKYFSGGSLSFNSAIPEDVALRYTKQLASALRFIHQKRMMHLDVKPSNILLDDEGNVVLIDFGLAKQYDNAGRQISTTPVGISHGYAPIEQYRCGGVSAFSPATDIYSLGATLYKLLTGTVPPEAMDLVATGVPACPANVSAETWNAVKSAMQPTASSRPQSVDEFLRLVESGKMQDESDGETVLNGNVKAASKREGENLFTHTASESSFDEVKGENGKFVADEFHSIDVVEVPDSEDAVISNESEKSQKNKPGKSLWLILLLLLIAGVGMWLAMHDNDNDSSVPPVIPQPPKLCSLTLENVPDSAKIFVDNTFMGEAPINGPIEIEPGEHTIKITKDGYEDYEKTENLSAGPQTINVSLVKCPPAPDVQDHPKGNDVKGNGKSSPKDPPLGKDGDSQVTDTVGKEKKQEQERIANKLLYVSSNATIEGDPFLGMTARIQSYISKNSDLGFADNADAALWGVYVKSRANDNGTTNNGGIRYISEVETELQIKELTTGKIVCVDSYVCIGQNHKGYMDAAKEGYNETCKKVADKVLQYCK